ncbi:mechanosensitive ion channel family protein [Massilia timonae]|uniref:mechanosensitive ion channel family protein n=1 Tax=Massilia timonae TaxID=47229 RepID=UPI0028D86C25|nr:mechanosensitive ion channel family protein [Massilia timonae]
MTRASYVTPGQTAARIENLRRLVAELLVRSMRRDEVGDLLEMGPSGVRKYIKELGDRVTTVRTPDGPVYFIAMTLEHAQAYLAQLAAAPVSRPTGRPKLVTAEALAVQGRHIHLLMDDSHYSVRMHSAPAARDPLVAAFFGPRAVGVRP